MNERAREIRKKKRNGKEGKPQGEREKRKGEKRGKIKETIPGGRGF